MAQKRVVRRSPAAAAAKGPEETAPGDLIELSISESVKGNGGERWVKVGLTSAHRPEETSEDAVERVQDFVITSLEHFKQASS